MENPSARELWAQFLKGQIVPVRRIQPRVAHFFDNTEDSRRSLQRVLERRKTSYSQSLQVLQLRNEVIPRVYDFVILTDFEGEARCIVKNTRVQLLPWFGISQEHAQTDGEGDLSLHDWKKIHWGFFARELARYGRIPKEAMIVVHQKFEVIYTA